jgi:hypothetical protein
VVATPDATDAQHWFWAAYLHEMYLALAKMEVALDALADLPGLRLDPHTPAPVIRGLNLRGPDTIHVEWDAAGLGCRRVEAQWSLDANPLSQLRRILPL